MVSSISRYLYCAKFRIAAYEFQIEAMPVQCTTVKPFCNRNLDRVETVAQASSNMDK